VFLLPDLGSAIQDLLLLLIDLLPAPTIDSFAAAQQEKGIDRY
jgi:hypothetical protein